MKVVGRWAFIEHPSFETFGTALLVAPRRRLA